MPNRKTDQMGYTTQDPEVERDIAGKGGPAIGTGIPDSDRDIPAPYGDDLQTQIAAKGKKKKENGDKNDPDGNADHQNNKD